MLITERITLANDKIRITPKLMFDILYISYLNNVKRLRNEDKTKYPYKTKINHSGNSYIYHFKAIMYSQLLMDFIEWKPYIKSINLELLDNVFANLIDKVDDKYDKTLYEQNDHKIRILMFLYNKGMYFEKFKDVTQSIKSLAILFLYGKRCLEQIFEIDFKPEKMFIFSNKSKGTIVNTSYELSRRRKQIKEELKNVEHQAFHFDTAIDSTANYTTTGTWTSTTSSPITSDASNFVTLRVYESDASSFTHAGEYIWAT